MLACAKAKLITDLFVDWLSTSGRPLSIVNDPGFQSTGSLTFLEPDFKLPSQAHVASLVKMRHRDGKKDLGDLLQAAPSMALARADVLIMREPIGSLQ